MPRGLLALPAVVRGGTQTDTRPLATRQSRAKKGAGVERETEPRRGESGPGDVIGRGRTHIHGRYGVLRAHRSGGPYCLYLSLSRSLALFCSPAEKKAGEPSAPILSYSCAPVCTSCPGVCTFDFFISSFFLILFCEATLPLRCGWREVFRGRGFARRDYLSALERETWKPRQWECGAERDAYRCAPFVRCSLENGQTLCGPIFIGISRC